VTISGVLLLRWFTFLLRWFTFATTVFRLCRIQISTFKIDKIGNNYVRKPQGKLLLAVLKPM